MLMSKNPLAHTQTSKKTGGWQERKEISEKVGFSPPKPGHAHRSTGMKAGSVLGIFVLENFILKGDN